MSTISCVTDNFSSLNPEPVFAATKKTELKLNTNFVESYEGKPVLAVPVAHCFKVYSCYNYSTAVKEKLYLSNCSIRQC